MTFATDELRRLQNFYGERTLGELLKWGDEAMSIGRPGGKGPWVDRDGTVNPSERTPAAWDPMEAALILRPEPRKANGCAHEGQWIKGVVEERGFNDDRPGIERLIG